MFEPEQVTDQLRRWGALGVQRVLLQLLDPDDAVALDLLAREVVNAVR